MRSEAEDGGEADAGLPGPAALARYLRSLIRRRPEHHAGHNPAGAVMILLLWSLSLFCGATGWLVWEDALEGAFEAWHEYAADALLGLIVLHVAGVIVASWLHGENLVAAMITGRKRGAPADAVPRRHTLAGLLMLAVVAGVWALVL